MSDNLCIALKLKIVSPKIKGKMEPRIQNIKRENSYYNIQQKELSHAYNKLALLVHLVMKNGLNYYFKVT